MKLVTFYLLSIRFQYFHHKTQSPMNMSICTISLLVMIGKRLNEHYKTDGLLIASCAIAAAATFYDFRNSIALGRWNENDSYQLVSDSPCAIKCRNLHFEKK